VCRPDDGYARLQVLTTRVRNGDPVLPLWFAEVEQRLQFTRFHERLVIDNNPKPAGETDPGIIRRPELRGYRPLDFSHIQGTEHTGYAGLLKASSIVGEKQISGCPIALCLEPVD
jgi:hypothetical protein